MNINQLTLSEDAATDALSQYLATQLAGQFKIAAWREENRSDHGAKIVVTFEELPAATPPPPAE